MASDPSPCSTDGCSGTHLDVTRYTEFARTATCYTVAPMDERRIPVSFRVSSRFKRCLELAAKHEQRSQTNFIEKLVFDYCVREGLDPDNADTQNSTRASKKGHK